MTVMVVIRETRWPLSGWSSVSRGWNIKILSWVTEGLATRSRSSKEKFYVLADERMTDPTVIHQQKDTIL